MEEGPRAGLVGRARELRRLGELAGGARAGRGGTLVLRGEAGTGKTALIAAMLDRAPWLRRIDCSGAGSETAVGYAGVQRLCVQAAGLLDLLPDAPRAVLQRVLGLGATVDADGPRVGLALAALLTAAGADRPTVCVVDDAQRMDARSIAALAFAARRLTTTRAVLLFATRDPLEQLADVDELSVGGLSEAETGALLQRLVTERISDRARAVVIAESRGIPAALIAFRRGIGPDGLAGGYGLADAVPTRDPGVHRAAALPEATRTLLLLAAAEPAGEPAWFWSAAERLGVGPEATAPAEAVGLIRLDGAVRFDHPLLRAALYRRAPSAQRRLVHAALAAVIDDPAAADHRAWHRAHAGTVPDEAVAVELEQAVALARRRGGAAAAAFLARAVAATPDADRRARRALPAAWALLEAGRFRASERLVNLAVELTDDPAVSARANLLRAHLATQLHRDPDSPALLLAAAQRLGRADAARVGETQLEALTCALAVGRFAGDSARAPEALARRLGTARTGGGAVDALLAGLSLRVTDGAGAAGPVLRAAVTACLRELEARADPPRWYEAAVRASLDLFDLDSAIALTTRHLALARLDGRLALLAAPLSVHAGLCLATGRFDDAADALDELEALSVVTDCPARRVGPAAGLAAYRGRPETRPADAAAARGASDDVAATAYATAILHNGRSRYPQALAACLTGLAYDDVGIGGYLLVEAVEAAARCGRAAIAADATARLTARAAASETPTALGVAARSRALVGGPADTVDAEFRTAIGCLGQSPALLYRARTHLVYGEWLRRMNRRAEARVELQTAYDAFARVGAAGFGARAGRELRAAGAGVPRGSPGALTAQERHIARLAGEGYTNPEIGARLFISPRTVEWHLGRIFAKLAVTSRRQLREVRLEAPDRTPE